MEVLSAFAEDVRAGALAVESVEDHHFGQAESLINSSRFSLRTLDAIHLAVALGLSHRILATADKVMTEAAREFGFEVVSFF